MARKKYSRVTLFVLVQLLIVLTEQVRSEDEKQDDDELITQLLDTPIGGAEESEVSKIMKVLEAAELASTTTTTPSTTTMSTSTTTTTPKPSPFFNTESPFNFASRRGKTETSMDDLIPYLDSQLEEVSQWIDDGVKKGDNGQTLNRRSDTHDPPVEGLLWSTARAVWEVSRPVFLKTKTGRKISLIKDTIKLPFRTIGAVKSHIHDLKHHHHDYHHHHHPHDKRRSVLHHHPLDHGWGWDPHVVYVKYEPENSLFKSWIRFLYRVIKPAALTKIRLKKLLIRIKLKFLWGLIHLVKSAKLQKVFAALRAIQTKLQILKARKHPSLVVLKETGVTKAAPVYGWGWGWEPPPPVYSPPKPVYGPPVESGWKPGPPPSTSWSAPRQQSSYSNLDITYGPPAKTSHGYHSVNPSNTYGAPPKPKNPLRIAYNQDNTYLNYRPPPAQYLMAPEPSAHASEPEPQTIEAPSYAKYLQQFGINPSSLADSNPTAASDSTRYLRQSESDSSKELEVPYLIPNSTDTEEIKKRM